MKPFPIIEYAHKIGKNTAEFTTKDLAAFMKWWIKQPQREDLLKVTPKQREEYNKDVAGMKQWREKSMKNTTDQSMIDDGEAEETFEVMQDEQKEIVCEMGLTKQDVTALLFAISRVFEDYDMEGHEYGESLSGLKEGLEGVE